MMANLMGQNIGLRKLSGCAKAPLELVVKSQGNVNLLVCRTIKRPRSRARRSTARLCCVTKKYQLGMAISHALRRQYLGPGLLRVIQHIGDKLHRRLFLGVARVVRLGYRTCRRNTAAVEQRKKVPLEYKAQ